MDVGLEPDPEAGRDCHGEPLVDDLPGCGWIRVAALEFDPWALEGGFSVISWLFFFFPSFSPFGFMYDSRPIVVSQMRNSRKCYGLVRRRVFDQRLCILVIRGRNRGEMGKIEGTSSGASDCRPKGLRQGAVQQ